MQIGLIGYYGHSNAGDDRILECLQRFFSEHSFVVTHSFGDALKRVDELNRCDFVLLGGGGLILRRFGKYATLIEQLKPRFGCVGISVEAFHEDNVDLINVVKEKSEFIVVRDARSQALLGNDSKVMLGPDLTFLYPFDVCPPVPGDICGVNLRPWHFWQWELNGTLHQLTKKLTKRIPHFESLYPFPRWKPEKAMHILTNSFSTLVPIPLSFETHEMADDVQVLKNFFKFEDNNFSPDLYTPCRYHVGMRLHALIFACQMGIPFISLSYQPKNTAFCISVGMEHFSVDLFNLSTLHSKITEMKQNYDSLRAQLLDVRQKNQHEIESIMHQVRAVVTR